VREFDSFNAVTRRALSINYRCPLICELIAESSGSGSGSSVTATLEIDATFRKVGPTDLMFAGDVLIWQSPTYIIGFVVYYSTSAEGPFSILASNVLDMHFDVAGSLPPGTYYFKVTGLEPDAGETFPSPIAGPLTLT
jgi:hypothetical protein